MTELEHFSLPLEDSSYTLTSNVNDNEVKITLPSKFRPTSLPNILKALIWTFGKQFGEKSGGYYSPAPRSSAELPNYGRQISDRLSPRVSSMRNPEAMVEQRQGQELR